MAIPRRHRSAGFIFRGSPGCVRSSAEILLLLSMLRTSVCSGGPVHNLITSRSFFASRWSRLILNVSTRQGRSPWAPHMRRTVAGLMLRAAATVRALQCVTAWGLLRSVFRASASTFAVSCF